MPPRAGPSQPRGVGASQFAPRRSGRAADAARAVSSSNESGSESADEEGDGDASSDEGDEVVDAPRKRQKRGERRAEGSGKGGGGGAAEGERGAVDKARAAMGAANFDSKVAEVMKLALMMEQRKQPLRRDDINKKILEAHARNFKPVFAEANRLLRTRFGMELVQLRAKGRADGQTPAVAGAAAGASQTRARNGHEGEGSQANRSGGGGGARGKGKGKGKGKGPAADGSDEDDDEVMGGAREKGGASRAYILRSTLPAELLPLLAVPQPLAAARPFVGGAAGTDRPEDSGAILDLAQDTGGGVGGPACTGLVWTILGLILVNDRSMTDAALHSILKSKFDIAPDSLLHFMPPTAITPPPTLDAFLKALQRKGYLEQAGEAAGGGARAGAAGAAAQTAEGGTDIEWQWGPRADAEIGEKAVARFLFDITESARDEDDAEVVAAPRRGRRDGAAGAQPQAVETADARWTKMLRNIEKAAGGVLVG